MNKGNLIENKSFEIIEKNVNLEHFNESERLIIKKLIHTTGDYQFADTTIISKSAIETGIKAIRDNTPIVCDTMMVKSGITSKYLKNTSCKVYSFIHYKNIIKRANQRGLTRAEAAIDFSTKKFKNAIYVIGNAPTALIRLLNLYNENKVKPSLIIGFPVGFVSAAEAKDRLARYKNLAFITNKGPKGGSACAATVINGLLTLYHKNSLLKS